MSSVRIKRGTRAQLDAAKAASQLKQGEPYLITDELRFAVGNAVNDYSAFLKEGEGGSGGAIGMFPFYKANGVRDDVNLTGANKLPFFKTGGASSDIPMVIL